MEKRAWATLIFKGLLRPLNWFYELIYALFINWVGRFIVLAAHFIVKAFGSLSWFDLFVRADLLLKIVSFWVPEDLFVLVKLSYFWLLMLTLLSFIRNFRPSWCMCQWQTACWFRLLSGLTLNRKLSYPFTLVSAAGTQLHSSFQHHSCFARSKNSPHQSQTAFSTFIIGITLFLPRHPWSFLR